MPLYRVAPTGQLPHTIDLIQRQSAPRFANEVERDQQYPDPELGALAVINTTVQVFNGTGWIPVGGGQPTLINHLQDVDARFPPDGAVLTWSSAAQAWGWSMPATPTTRVCDDFERADGPLGPNWQLGPPPGWSDENHPLTIDSGDAIGTAAIPTPGSFPYVTNSMSWTTPLSPTQQSIEIEVEGLGSSADTGKGQYFLLYTNGTLGSLATQAADFQFGIVDDIAVSLMRFDTDGAWTNVLGSVALHFTRPPEPFRVRYESDPDGTQRVYLNGENIVEVVDGTPCVGTLVGMSLDYSAGQTSPRILEACVGGDG